MQRFEIFALLNPLHYPKVLFQGFDNAVVMRMNDETILTLKDPIIEKHSKKIAHLFDVVISRGL